MHTTLARVLAVEDRRWWLPLIGGLYLVSFAVLAWLAWQRSGVGVLVAGVALVATSLLLNRVLRCGRRGAVAQVFRWVVPAAMAVLGIVLLVLWRPGDATTEGWGFLGLTSLYLGVGQLLAAVRCRRRWHWVLGIVLVTACAALFVAGLVGFAEGAAGWPRWVLAAGVLLSPVALSLLSEGVLCVAPARGAPPARVGLMLTVIGAVVAVAGVWAMVAAAGIEFRYALIGALVLVVLIGAIASNTPVDVVIVAVVVALVWSVIPSGEDPTVTVQPGPGDRTLVALGDSYMSGEGARRYFAGTNHKGHNECRRAPTAYTPVAVSGGQDGVPEVLAFLACSGARTSHIGGSPQQPGEPVDGPPGGLNQLDQYDRLRPQLDVALVVVSIGGNDAHFGSIGRYCVAPGDCTEIAKQWLDGLADVSSTVYETYRQIRDRLGDTVPIVVVPYPIPLNENKCSWSLLTANEHRFLYGYTSELNRVLRRAAEDAGLFYLDPIVLSLGERELRICDGNNPADVGVNFFAMNSVRGLFEQSINPQNWFHNSFHPNEQGHEAMADTLVEWLRQNPDLTPRADPLADRGAPPIATVEQIMRDDQFRHCGNPNSGLPHCDGSANDWARAQLVDTGWRLLPWLLLIIIGIWAAWLWPIWLWRRHVSKAMEPPEPARRQ